MKIVIIGAGPCGLLHIKYLKDISNAEVECFEFKDDIGGQWNTIDDIKKQWQQPENKIHTENYDNLNCSIYDGMITNIPKQMMAYKGFPHPEETPDFINTKQFFEYLQKYEQKHCLKQYIKFGTFVEKVRLVENLSEEEKQKYSLNQNQQQKKFVIQFVNKLEPQNKKYVFCDYLIVANGHYTSPNIPQIFQNPLWQDKIIHSSNYRKDHLPKFEQKTILIYGIRPSGQDLLDQIINFTEKKPKNVYFVGDPIIANNMQQNSKEYRKDIDQGILILKPCKIQQLNEDGHSIVLQDYNDQSITEVINNIDHIILCTGYKHTLPFISEKDKIIDYYNKDGRMNAFGPLYKGFLSINCPQLFFPGLQKGFLQVQYKFERAAILIKRIIEGKANLPNIETMMKDFQSHYDFMKTKRPTFDLFFKANIPGGQFIELDYNKQLFELTGLPQEQFDVETDKITEEYMKKIIPLQYGGEYPRLKQSVVVGEFFPQNFAPQENLF